MDSQLLGGDPSGLASAHMYQLCFSLAVEARLSLNQGWSFDVWQGTMSKMIFKPSPCAKSIKRVASCAEPNIGSTA